MLYVAQSALSQQLLILEGELKQPLLVRSRKGVVPTQAGKVLYKHAQSIMRQCKLAHEEVQNASENLSGSVTVGLAQFSSATNLAVPLLRRVREEHPGIIVYANENSSVPMSELIMSGRVDLAVIGPNLYGGVVPHGLSFEPLIDEPLYLVAPKGSHPNATLTMADLAHTGIVLPGPNHFLRRLIDDSFAKLGLKPVVLAETTSMTTLADLVIAGIGAALLPESLAWGTARGHPHLSVHAIADPAGLVKLSLCQSELQPLSAAAEFVKTVLIDLASQQQFALLASAAA